MNKNLNAKEITSWVYALHADIKDAPYFEGFWPIPHGVSLNSYIVKSDKVALIDLYRDWEDAPEKMKSQMSSIGIDLCDIHYLVLNHLESDHSGFLKDFRKMCPNAKIVTTKKGAELVEKFCKAVNDNEKDFQNTAVQVVKTGDSIDLGQGVVLHFTETPNVHWPETMMTYEEKSKVLFSCDAFGSYGCVGTKENPSRIFDDECTEEELIFFEKEALRYYANIVASFSHFVKQAIDKFSSTQIKVVAPSHGLVWRKNPKRIINDYIRYAGYNTGGELEKEICVIWGSMYGNTKIGLDAVIEGIKEEGVNVNILEIPSTNASFVLGEAYKAKGIVLAMPTYEYKMYPPMAYILNLFNRKHFSGKKALRIGSWGWIGGAKREYDEAVLPLKWEEIESYEWQGLPCAEDKTTLKERGRELARQVKNS
ncbi:MAG: FprA family A-type flavoprotein [Treponema sp.]|nr:FprA family A-type flavoprotein [Treponema sp.]